MERSNSDNKQLTTDTTALFVYGTLRRGLENPFARRLRREAAFLTSATLPGAYLVDAGGYPGLLRTDNPAHVVSGDLFRLPANPLPLLRALDPTRAARTIHRCGANTCANKPPCNDTMGEPRPHGSTFLRLFVRSCEASGKIAKKRHDFKRRTLRKATGIERAVEGLRSDA